MSATRDPDADADASQAAETHKLAGPPPAPEASAEPVAPPRQAQRVDTGSGWAPRSEAPRSEAQRSEAQRSEGVGGQETTTVLPSGGRRPAPPRPATSTAARSTPRPVAGRARRARLTLRRIDPWSVFLFSLVASVFVGLALVVAVAVLYAVLGTLGVTESLNELYAEVTGGDVATDALLTSGRIVGGAAVLAAVNVVFLTLLATLSALLYNLCSSFTGGIELTFGERD